MLSWEKRNYITLAQAVFEVEKELELNTDLVQTFMDP